MSSQIATARPKLVFYPESDGKPIADNTKQFRYIVTIQGGLDALFADDPNVLVVGDLFWYPVEGEPKIVQAPDIMVAIGRPRGDRRSYKQWKEGGIAPQVVWEVMSHKNTRPQMARKFDFYERHGIEEYYVYDPERGTVEGYLREGDSLKEIPNMQGWISPRLKIRFELDGDNLILYLPDGRRFETFVELAQRAKQTQLRADQAEREKEALARELAELKAKMKNMSGPGA